MWIFTTNGFLSIVQHKDADGHFQIKSRVRAPLEELWPDHEILEIGWADYRSVSYTHLTLPTKA